jgi:hypothetical protein
LYRRDKNGILFNVALNTIIKFGDWEKKDSPYISLPKGSIVVPLNNNRKYGTNSSNVLYLATVERINFSYI